MNLLINKKNALSVENPDYLTRNPHYLVRDEANNFVKRRNVRPEHYRQYKPNKTINTE